MLPYPFRATLYSIVFVSQYSPSDLISLTLGSGKKGREAYLVEGRLALGEPKFCRVKIIVHYMGCRYLMVNQLAGRI